MAESAVLLVAAFAAGYGGFALLALSLPRHWHDLTGQPRLPPGRRLRQRVAGYAGLVLACGLAAWHDGPAFGSLLAILLLTACAAAVAFTMAWRPQWLGGLVRVLR